MGVQKLDPAPRIHIASVADGQTGCGSRFQLEERKF